MKRSIGILALVTMWACGGTPFSSTDFAQTDGGPSPEAAAQFDQTADQVVDHRTTSPEGAPDAGTDAVTVDPDAGTAPDAAPDGMTMGEDAAADAGADTAPSEDADAGCVPVTHDNGVGQTWQDCVPLGTYNLSQAMKACVAYAGDAKQCFEIAPGCGTDPSDVRTLVDLNYIWRYSGNAAGDVDGTGGVCGPISGAWN